MIWGSGQALLDLEGQAEFGDVQGPGQRAVGQLLDTAQAVPHGVGMTVFFVAVSLAEPPSCDHVGMCRAGSCAPRFGSSLIRRSTIDLIFAMTSGALTAATASGLSSNTVMSESPDGFPVTANRANRSASLVSARSSNGGLMPTRTVATWRSTEVSVLIVSPYPHVDDADV